MNISSTHGRYIYDNYMYCNFTLRKYLLVSESPNESLGNERVDQHQISDAKSGATYSKPERFRCYIRFRNNIAKQKKTKSVFTMWKVTICFQGKMVYQVTVTAKSFLLSVINCCIAPKFTYFVTYKKLSWCSKVYVKLLVLDPAHINSELL